MISPELHSDVIFTYKVWLVRSDTVSLYNTFLMESISFRNLNIQ